MFEPTKSKAAPGQGRRGNETSPAGSGLGFCPHYTRVWPRLQSKILAGGYVVRDGLLLVAEGLSRIVRWLADRAEQLDSALYLRSIGL